MLCFAFPLFCVLSLYFIETKALDLLLELVPFIVLKQHLHETGCRSLSLCDCCLKGWGGSSESHMVKAVAFIENIRKFRHRDLGKGANHQRVDLWTIVINQLSLRVY